MYNADQYMPEPEPRGDGKDLLSPEDYDFLQTDLLIAKKDIERSLDNQPNLQEYYETILAVNRRQRINLLLARRCVNHQVSLTGPIFIDDGETTGELIGDYDPNKGLVVVDTSDPTGGLGGRTYKLVNTSNKSTMDLTNGRILFAGSMAKIIVDGHFHSNSRISDLDIQVLGRNSS